MTFEDQITRAFDTLTERLRGEIGQQIQRTAAEIAAAAPSSDCAPLDAAAPAPAADAASRQRLADGFEAIDRARSLTDILDTVVSFARQESSRAEVWLIRGGRPHRWRSAGHGAAGDDTPPRPLDEGIPLTIAGTVVAVLHTELPTPHSEPGTTNDQRRTTNVALLARYAGRSLEALTAFKTARALTQRSDDGIADRGLRNADSDEASEEDSSARRYARLLVSEIKLYHEAAVVDGRRDRDLVSRLGGEITHARVMYEQRVPAHVRERADYFHDELVRTLANGDSSLLGS